MEIKIHKLKIFRYIKPKSHIREYDKNSELDSREHPGSSSDMSPQSSLPSQTCKQHPGHLSWKRRLPKITRSFTITEKAGPSPGLLKAPSGAVTLKTLC